MTSSIKSQIIRQKNVECVNPTLSLTKPDSNCSSDCPANDDVESNSLNSSPKLNNSIDTELQYLSLSDYNHSESASSTSIDKSNGDESPGVNIPGRNSSMSEGDDNKKNSFLSSSVNSKTLSSILNNGGKLQISTALRARLRRSKSPNPKKPLLSNNSMPTTDPKMINSHNNMLSNFSNRLSNQNGSFFSRSCQGEELAYKKDVENSNCKSGNSSNNSSNINLNTTKLRSFLAFARSGQKPRNNTSLSVDDNDSVNSSSMSSPTYSKQNSIGSYDVDFEKLARELILPSLNEPLTSFKTDQCKNEATHTKPVLQSCKTIDISNVKKKHKLARANTGNQ